MSERWREMDVALDALELEDQRNQCRNKREDDKLLTTFHSPPGGRVIGKKVEFHLLFPRNGRNR